MGSPFTTSCKQLWAFLSRPSTRFSLGGLFITGAVVGILFWGGFNWTLELTNTEAFCISCHEMESTVYQEYKEKIHYSNRSGVKAICSDCHVPKDWTHKMIRKVKASNELFHKIIGTVNTKEKFEAHRLELAKRVWATMKATDSRECRNCHSMAAMDLAKQKPRARAQHESSIKDKETCIDCHKGIAHKKLQEEENKTEPAEQDFTL